MAFASKKSKIGSASAAALLATGLTGVASVVAILPAGTAQAQVPFHALRPVNNSRVREVVRLLFSRAALGEAKYVQLIIDDRFRSAIAIPPPAKDPVYTDQVESSSQRVALLWNTKAIDTTPNIPDEQRIVQDGPHTIEVIALDAGGRRIGKETLTVNVDNRIPTPADGIAMDYKFALGDLSTYNEKSTVNFIAADNQGMGGGGNSPYGGGYGQRAYYGSQRNGAYYGQGGGNPDGGAGGYGNDQGASNAIVPVQLVRAKFERTTEDYLGSDTFFIRDKVLGGIIQAGSSTAAYLSDVYDFKSRYRTVDITGNTRDYGKAARPGAYVALSLPGLGGGRRRVGNTWRTRTPVQLEWATLDAPPMVYAENNFEGMEWQDGYQTARIHQKFDGKVDMPIYGGAGVIKDAKVSMDRVIWFGYKAGKIVRMETTVTVEGDAPQSIVSAMAPNAGQTGGGAPGGGPEGMGGPGGGPGGMMMPGGMGMRGGGMKGGGMMMPGGGGGGFPGAPEGGGLLGTPGGNLGGGFGAMNQGPQEEAKVPAKFQSVTIVTLNRYNTPTSSTSKVAQK